MKITGGTVGIKVGDHWKSKSPSVTFGEGAIVSGNSTISNFVVRYGGGGIYNAGTLTMTGGSVTNCTASNSGGFYMREDKFIMNGGEIRF